MHLYWIMKYLHRWMIALNLIMVVYLSTIFFYTPRYIALQADGLHVTQSLDHLPAQPWTGWISVVGILALIAVSLVHHHTKWGAQHRVLNYWNESILCLVTIVMLHLDYNGLMLLVVVDLIDTMLEKERTVFLGAMILLYLVTSLDMVQSGLHMVSVTAYFSCYDFQVRQLMQSAVGLLTALNFILFMGYMVLLVGLRTRENGEIRQLNGELESVNDRLAVMNEQLKAYAAESERMAETRERNRLAREIHDTLGHALTGIAAGTDACLQMMEASPEIAKKQMELIASTARQGIGEVRRSVNALRPDALERFELTDALHQLCNDMQAASHAKIYMKIDTNELRLSPDEEDVVYRTVQESMTNAIRHGKATEIWIEIYCIEREMEIIVQDNGAGCNDIKPGFGLRHMRERLGLLNGTLRWNGKNGFRIEAIIPLRWGDEI